MNDFFTLFREFPALWAFIGSLLTAPITFIVTSRTAPAYSKANKDLVTLHEDMVGSYKAQIDELKVERDDYRDKLHGLRDSAHARAQMDAVKIAELEARPNVDHVYKAQQEFFGKMGAHMDEQTKTLKTLNSSFTTILEAIQAK